MSSQVDSPAQGSSQQRPNTVEFIVLELVVVHECLVCEGVGELGLCLVVVVFLEHVNVVLDENALLQLLGPCYDSVVEEETLPMPLLSGLEAVQQ